jgi:cell division protein FtsI (penicillin-binding protein 3)
MLEARERYRMWTVIIGLGVFAVAIAARFVWLMVVQPMPDPRSAVQVADVERGPILDRNGRLLAIATRFDSVSVWTPDVTDPTATAATLSEVLGLDRSRLEERLRSRPYFAYLKRKITPTQSAQLRTHLQAGELRGVSLKPEFGRTYPEQELASHVLGFVGVDDIGLAGIENTFNHVLSPAVIRPGQQLVRGHQVVLTIDVNVQYAIEQIAVRARTEHRADWVTILVMVPSTGELLAYATSPRYDPNSIDQSSAQTRTNRPVAVAFEPGSVFKVFSIASLLEHGAVTPDDTFYCGGHYTRRTPGGGTIRIADLRAHGTITTADIIRYSCNAGAAYASDRIDGEGFHAALSAFGFGSAVDLPFSGETAGIFHDVDRWSLRSKPTVAMGQEVAVSAVQIVRAASAIANDGMMMRPRIVRRVVAADGTTVKDFPPEPVRQVVKPAVARTVLAMMAGATEPGGTAVLARVRGLRVSGKTGTAEILDESTGSYSDDAVIASFLAIAPTDDPQVIFYAVIHNPRGTTRYGGLIAAPLFAEAAEFLVPYLSLSNADAPRVQYQGAVTRQTPPVPEPETAIGDYRGLPKRSLLPLLSDRRLRVRLVGNGFVHSQSPPPGTPIRDGLEVRITLR